MIPTRPTQYLIRKMTRNVIETYRRATDQQHQQGVAWYWSAHDTANRISGGNTRVGAGVIAALSVQKEWNLNVTLAERALKQGYATGHTKDAINKVASILIGTDPVRVLPMSKKTGHFYRSILDPTDPDAVCIDRHAHDLAVGTRYGTRNRGLDSQTRYDVLARVYRNAAARVGVLPSELQAVTWTVQVTEHQYART